MPFLLQFNEDSKLMTLENGYAVVFCYIRVILYFIANLVSLDEIFLVD